MLWSFFSLASGEFKREPLIESYHKSKSSQLLVWSDNTALRDSGKIAYRLVRVLYLKSNRIR